jgi:8-oxo-dGTP diphosphatase
VIYLIRHGQAGSRAEWTGPDRERPLSGRGTLQAVRLGERLVAAGATRVYSSPYARCLQTVGPLAAMLGVEIEESEHLAEGAGPEGAARLVADAPPGSVLCTHGDVLHHLAGHLAAHGAPLVIGMPFEKGAVLRLRRNGGTVVSAEYEAPDRWPAAR